MRKARLWNRLLGARHSVIDGVNLEPAADGAEVLVARVRPVASRQTAALAGR